MARDGNSRVLLVANRLPVTIKLDGGRVAVERSAGGVATGLQGPHERSGGKWVGWPGSVRDLSEAQRGELDGHLAGLGLVPLYLGEEEVARYYEGFANGALWPLFHYLLDKVVFEAADFAAYREVNEKYAERVAEQYQAGDLIWVQDYQLMLLPGMLRARLPEARIGFFLHIPWPSSEVFRLLPWREEILTGILGADLVGFHTHAYMRHFSSAALRLLGLEPHVDQIEHEGRLVRLGAYPMGVDTADFARRASGEAATSFAAHLRGADAPKLLVGIDRLDYTKGVPRRFLTVERLLELHPELVGRVKLVQVAVPSRTGIPAYDAFRRSVDELVGRINGRFGTPDWVPIHYLYRGLSQDEIVGLYLAADVMLVTPLRDGMNLVAKEFVASRPDEDGVLVLSELAGAAAELGQALRVNPYDIDGTARTIAAALALPRDEQTSRMRSLRRTVTKYDVHAWARSFLDDLEASHADAPGTVAKLAAPGTVDALVADSAAAPRVVLALDYDGTIVDFTDDPADATPDPELLALLARLGADPRIELHIVSGRTRADLERWFAALPIGLHAEHGLVGRLEPDPKGAFIPAFDSALPWKEDVRAIFKQFASRTPGALIEEKTASLAWHYRKSDPEFGALQARELRLHLTEVLSNLPVEVLRGAKVIEVRPHGVNKGAVASRILARARATSGVAMVVIGDDRTDEDMFAVMPPEAATIVVGARPSRARYRLRDPRAARAFLARLTRAA